MKVGKIKKFGFGTFLIKKKIDTTDFKYKELRNGVTCPHCAKSFGESVTYDIKEVYVMKGIKCADAYIGISTKGHTLKLPNEAIEEVLKKNKEN